MAGSNRWPRKGEPSASHPFFSISWTFYNRKQTGRLTPAQPGPAGHTRLLQDPPGQLSRPQAELRADPLPRLSPPRAAVFMCCWPFPPGICPNPRAQGLWPWVPAPPHQPSGLLGMSSQSSQLAAIPGQSPGTLPLPACTGRGHQCPHQLREALPVGPVPRLLVVWWPQQVLLKHERRAQR